MNKSKAVLENAGSRISFGNSNVLVCDNPQVVIIADDLTGACDSAAAFLGERRRAKVWLGHGGYDLSSSADVWSFSTETRNEAASIATRRVKAIAEELRRLIPTVTFFKKVDSAGRGHCAEEMEAARMAIGADVTVYAPAFPAAGRHVSNGVLHLHDTTGKDSNVRLRELFPQEMRERIALIPTGTDLDVEWSMHKAINECRHVLLCDAGCTTDLQRIVRVARRLPQRLLWAGSAGLGFEFAQTLSAGMQEVNAGVRRRGKILIVCGSPHPLTRIQMERLYNLGRDVQMDCVVTQVRCGVSSDDELRIIFNDAGRVGSLVLTGGDTAAMVLRAFGAESIEVTGEIDQGIPWGIVHGGLADGCIVITKSGGFGDEHVLVDALHFCRGVAS